MRVQARLVGEGLDPARLLDTETDDSGEVSISLALPTRAASAVVFAADAESGAGRLRVEF